MLLVLVLSLPGCRACATQPAPEASDAGGPTVAPCSPRTGEHLGIPFVKICPQDLGAAGAAFEPFWISAQQIGCSSGEHDTLRCPHVTGLRHPASGESRIPSSFPGSLAAVVEPNIAQSVCYMRFAGRLPTRAERASAEAAMGLASVIVAQSPDAPTHFELVRLGEWVTEAPCQVPNASGCSPVTHPSGPRQPIPWGRIVSCAGAPLAADAGAAFLAIGESCPAAGFAWDGGTGLLPCAVRSPAVGAPVFGFSLTCRAPEPSESHPEDDVTKTAAFRCVLPQAAVLPNP